MFSYLRKTIQSFLDNTTKELKSHRTLLCWLYAIAYLILIHYCIIHNPSTMNTAIMTTGGICGTIFSAWVIGSAHVSATRIRYPVDPSTPVDDPVDMTDPGF